jgi:hypothetical protein
VLKVDRRFKGTRRLYLQDLNLSHKRSQHEAEIACTRFTLVSSLACSSALKMEATSADFQTVSRRYIPKDRTLRVQLVLKRIAVACNVKIMSTRIGGAPEDCNCTGLIWA